MPIIKRQLTKRVTLQLTEAQYEILFAMADRRGLIAFRNGRPSVSMMIRLLADGYYRLVKAEKKCRGKPSLISDDIDDMLSLDDIYEREERMEYEILHERQKVDRDVDLMWDTWDM